MGVMLALGACVYAVVASAARPRERVERPIVRTRSPAGREPIQPISFFVLDPSASARADLGARLFADRRLSHDDSVACADCHALDRAGADGRRTAVGFRGRVGLVNTPTVFNSGLNDRQFWNGRAESLEAQIDGPLLNPGEMAGSWAAVLDVLSRDPSYREAFDAAYPGTGIATESVRNAIATYERTLVTPHSRFDRWLEGDASAIGANEKAGYELFKTYGCIDCHQGENVGGNLFEKLGLIGDYFKERGGEITEADLGRFVVTKREEDRYRFRVPSLRLAARTAPYFHDGSVATLDEAIVIMGRHQLGVQIPPDDVVAIHAFLESLVGDVERRTAHAQR